MRPVDNPQNPFESVERQWLEEPPEVRGYLLVGLVRAAAACVTLQGVIPGPQYVFYPVVVALSFITSLPYLADRLIASRLQDLLQKCSRRLLFKLEAPLYRAADIHQQHDLKRQICPSFELVELFRRQLVVEQSKVFRA